MSHVLGKQCCNKQIPAQSNSEMCHDSSLSGSGSHLKVNTTGRCAGLGLGLGLGLGVRVRG